MNTSSNSNKPIFVSTFLSHSSTDKTLVETVAERLSRRGVLAWLDKNELAMGALDAALKQAVQRQTTITIFLSKASLASSWCRDELLWAIEAQEDCEHLLPVYLGNPLELVRAHDLLRTRFLHPDGDRVNQNGFFCNSDPTNPNPDAIAEEIAKTVYQRSIPKLWSEIAIVLDQRGNGQRRGEPSLPANFANLQLPILTFRPDLGLRQQGEVLTGKDWKDMVQTMISSLACSLGTMRGDLRKVRVLGEAQTGLVWALGMYFNRTTDVDLYGYGRDNLPITNRGQVRLTPLEGGDPHRAELLNESNTNQLKVALGVGSKEKYAQAVKNAVPDISLFWIESGSISDSDQAMKLVADIVASVLYLRQVYNVNELVMFWTTANHVALLAAANLTKHVIHKIQYMEWDRSRMKYVHLPMPDAQ